MNSGITLIDVRSEAMDVIQKLKKGEIDLKTASEIRSLLGTVIDTAKVQVEFMKSLPNSLKENMDQDSIKAIAGTLRDRDAELDASLNEIDKTKNTWKP
jgi:hypothetical protein